MNTSAYEEQTVEFDNSLKQFTEITGTILWQGKIILKKNESNVVTKYAIIYDDRIVIRNKDEYNSPESLVISKDNIVSIEFPEIEQSKALLTGYRGFIIAYKLDDKIKEISLWAKGLGQHPNPEKMKSLSKALEVLYLAISDSTDEILQEDIIEPVAEVKITEIIETEAPVIDFPPVQIPEETLPSEQFTPHEVSQIKPQIQFTRKEVSKRPRFMPYLVVSIVSFVAGFIVASIIAVAVIALGFI